MGQKVYVEKTWVTGETCLYPITNQIEYLQAKKYITKIRTNFIQKIQEEGYEITYEKDEIDDNTICLIMDDTAICKEQIDISEYKKRFDQKIKEGAGSNFHYPYSLRISDYFNHPFFPAVFKNELTNGGEDKFLIEEQQQLDMIKSFYEQYHKNPKYQHALDCSIFQQYLETPSKYNTYLRVLVAASGDILGASLKYSARTTKSDTSGLLEQVFLNPDSKYFLNAKKMFNYYSGGGNISFCQPRYSEEKTKILKEHGIDPTNPKVPEEVFDVCKNIMENCHREIGVLCGIDFMLNKEDNHWYYLENQAFPAIEEWAQTKGISIPSSHNIKGYLKYLELELEPRKEALTLFANKKKNQVKVKQPNKKN